MELRQAIDDFLLTQGRLNAYLEADRKAPVMASDIYAREYDALQLGSYQLIVRVRCWVSWQKEPVTFIVSVAKAPPGMESRNEDSIGSNQLPDDVARAEAEHLAEYHEISPDLYDAPIARGYSAFGAGPRQKIFMHMMPFKRGIMEMISVLDKDGSGRLRRRFRLNHARPFLRDGVRGLDTVPMAWEANQAIEEKAVASVTKHWARSFAKYGTGKGLIDDQFAFNGGDMNLLGVLLGPEEAALGTDVSDWRVAARGRLETDAEGLLDYLLSPTDAEPEQAGEGAFILHPHYLAGDAEDVAVRQERVFRGILQGLAESGLPSSTRDAIERELWTGLVDRHEARLADLMRGTLHWNEFLERMRRLLVVSADLRDPDLSAGLIGKWMVDGVTGHGRFLHETVETLLESFGVPVPEDAAVFARMREEFFRTARSVGISLDATLLPAALSPLMQNHPAASRLLALLLIEALRQGRSLDALEMSRMRELLNRDLLIDRARARLREQAA